jgi:hypothetical protein
VALFFFFLLLEFIDRSRSVRVQFSFFVFFFPFLVSFLLVVLCSLNLEDCICDFFLLRFSAHCNNN